MKLYPILLFCITLATCVIGQQRVADSLKQLASNTSDYNTRFLILMELGRHYYFELGKADSSELVFRQCTEYARKNKKVQQEALALIQLAILNRNTNRWNAYSTDIKNALDIAQKNGLIKEEIDVKKEISTNYYRLGKTDSGTIIFDNALRIAKKNNLKEKEADLEAHVAGAIADWDPVLSRSLSSHALLLAKSYNLPEIEIRALTNLAYLQLVNQLDSGIILFKEALDKSKKQKSKKSQVRILGQLVSLGMGLKSRSVLDGYFNEGLQIAATLDSRMDSLNLVSAYAQVELITGSQPSALQKYLLVLSLNKGLGRPELDINALISIGFLYGEQLDFVRAFSHLNQARILIDQQKDTGHLIWHLYTMGSTHAKMKNKDSAEFYIKECDAIAKKYYSDQIPGHVLNEMGDIYYELENYQTALLYLRRSYADLLGTNGDPYNIALATNALAKTFNKLGFQDSCIYYSKLTLQLAQNFHMLSFIIKSANLLKTQYKNIDNTDSAFYFQEIAISANDSLYTLEKQRELSDITFKDQIQKQKIAEEIEKSRIRDNARLKLYFLAAVLGISLVIAGFLWRGNRQKQKARIKIENAYAELKSTQAQLIQSEKMASLGELTAGIAHEIQNPLNFINNFSEVNTELIDELQREIESGNFTEVGFIAKDIRENEQKINHHGKRADSIVKGMLQHSRRSNGIKESINLNKLADEYLRLAYHGLRAKDNSLTAIIKTDFDKAIGNLLVIPQDLGRVLLNLYSNAFYAVNQKKKHQLNGYEPMVSVYTKKEGAKVFISVKDNGNGIPENLLNKIFQPFFTTKPAGQGTGLGLSLSYDIVTAHGGEIKVETKNGEGTEFTIQLPIQNTE